MKRAVCGIILLLTVLLHGRGGAIILQAADSASLSISVSVVLEGALPETPDSFYVKLTPSGGQTPMPGEGEDTLVIQGEGAKTFSEILYTQPGIYRYTISQIQGDASCSYDGTQFHLTVTVVQEEKGLECAAVLYRETEGNKTEFPEFCNRYPEAPTKGPTKTPTKNPTKIPAEDQTGESTDTSKSYNPVRTGVEDHIPFYMAAITLSLMTAGSVFRRKRK